MGTEEEPEAAKGKWFWNSGKHPVSNRCSEYIDRLRKIYDLNLPNYEDPGVSGPPPHEARLHVQDPSSFCHQDHIVLYLLHRTYTHLESQDACENLVY